MHKVNWTPNQGTLVGDRYQLHGEIGRGGMGVVYEGMDVVLERPVALKFLDPDMVGDVEALDRFQREALTAGRIGHENICDVRDLGATDDGVPFIAMELLTGQSLADFVAGVERLEPVEAIDIMVEALAGLEAAHEAGVIHRDLKPENIFLAETLTGQRKVKLVDFGISKFTGEGNEMRLTKTGIVLGSPYYMSPEQARGRQDIDGRSDLFGVGVILFELLTGELPFSGENYNEVMIRIVTETPPRVRELNPSVHKALDALVDRALKKDRDKRFQSAPELAGALLEVRAKCPGAAERPPPRASETVVITPAKAPRSKMVLAGAVIGLVLLVGAGVGVAVSLSPTGASSAQPAAGEQGAPNGASTEAPGVEQATVSPTGVAAPDAGSADQEGPTKTASVDDGLTVTETDGGPSGDAGALATKTADAALARRDASRPAERQTEGQAREQRGSVGERALTKRARPVKTDGPTSGDDTERGAGFVRGREGAKVTTSYGDF